MNNEVTFDSIESAHEFIDLLAQVVLQTRREIEADIQRETNANFRRRLEALELTIFKMQTLEFHLKKSRFLLNDLRSLRRLLFSERTDGGVAVRETLTGAARAETAHSSFPPAEHRFEDDQALLGLTG